MNSTNRRGRAVSFPRSIVLSIALLTSPLASAGLIASWTVDSCGAAGSGACQDELLSGQSAVITSLRAGFAAADPAGPGFSEAFIATGPLVLAGDGDVLDAADDGWDDLLRGLATGGNPGPGSLESMLIFSDSAGNDWATFSVPAPLSLDIDVISSVEISVLAAHFDSPGQDPNGDGVWTDYGAAVRFDVFGPGRNVPEAGTLGMLAFGLLLVRLLRQRE